MFWRPTQPMPQLLNSHGKVMVPQPTPQPEETTVSPVPTMRAIPATSTITGPQLAIATLSTTITQHGRTPRSTPTLQSPNFSTLQTFTMTFSTSLDSTKRPETLKQTTMVKEVREAMLSSSTHKMEQDSTTPPLQLPWMVNRAECPCTSGTQRFPTATAVSMPALSSTNTPMESPTASPVVQQTPTA